MPSTLLAIVKAQYSHTYLGARSGCPGKVRLAQLTLLRGRERYPFRHDLTLRFRHTNSSHLLKGVEIPVVFPSIDQSSGSDHVSKKKGAVSFFLASTARFQQYSMYAQHVSQLGQKLTSGNVPLCFREYLP